jgi:hypothetical protein
MENIFKLKQFNEFVNEAVRTKDEAKAFDLIASYISRKMGENLYPYPFFEMYKKSDGTSGFGKRYFADSGKSIRVNVDQSEGSTDISSIDYWDGSSSEPAWTVDGHGQSLAKVLPQVADRLVNPEAELVAPNKVNEAKKVTEDSITKIIQLSSKMNAKQIASEVGLSPKSVREILKENNVVSARPAAKEKRNESQSEIEMVFSSEASLKDKVKLLDEIMEDIGDVVNAVALGNVNGLMLSGKAGTGKTHTVTATLEKAGCQYTMISGSTSTPGIVETLYDNNNGVIVFDDCDSVFDEQESRNILKAALDTKKVRTISYMKKNPKFYDPEKIFSPEQLEEVETAGRIPNRFEFTGRIIFISNLKKEKLDPDGAIRSRSLIIDVSPDDMTIMERMKRMLKFMEPMNMSIEEKEEVFEYIKDSKNVSMRTFVKAAMFKQTGVKNWKRILERYV